MTSEPLTAIHGVDKSISSAEDSLARIYRWQVREQESQEKGLDYGVKWRGLSVKYDRNTHLWRTHHCLFPEVLKSFSVTLPKWGMMQDGELWERTTPVRLTSEIESGLWPTPDANCGARGTQPEWKPIRTSGQSAQYPLNQAVRDKQTWPTPCLPGNGGSNGKAKLKSMLWPTPTAEEASKIPAQANYGQIGLNNHPRIRGEVTREKGIKSYPIPTSCEWKGRGPNSKQQGLTNDTGCTGGQLNPDWVGEQIKIFPTPTSGGVTGGCTGLAGGSGGRKKLCEMFGEEEGKKMGCGQLNPDWVEWLMGWPIGWTKIEPIALDWRDWGTDPADIGEVPRTGQKIPNRANRLKAIGNGQVPNVATLAWTILTPYRGDGRGWHEHLLDY